MSSDIDTEEEENIYTDDPESIDSDMLIILSMYFMAEKTNTHQH